jgi:hypothetical protein
VLKPVREAALRADKNVEGIKYWLWYMHHPDDNRWKNLGRPYRSLDAFLTWRRYYLLLPDHERLDRHPSFGATRRHAICFRS